MSKNTSTRTLPRLDPIAQAWWVARLEAHHGQKHRQLLKALRALEIWPNDHYTAEVAACRSAMSIIEELITQALPSSERRPYLRRLWGRYNGVIPVGQGGEPGAERATPEGDRRASPT